MYSLLCTYIQILLLNAVLTLQIPVLLLLLDHNKNIVKMYLYGSVDFSFLSIYSVEVLATLTSDVGRILSKLHRVQPQGTINLLTGIRIAHVSWKLQ